MSKPPFISDKSIVSPKRRRSAPESSASSSTIASSVLSAIRQNQSRLRLILLSLVVSEAQRIRARTVRVN